jgi:hypothetical protein
MTNYLCGFCCTPTAPFTDNEGHTGQHCPTCGSLWYDWELRRAAAWQAREEQYATRLANRLLKAETSQLAFTPGKARVLSNG